MSTTVAKTGFMPTLFAVMRKELRDISRDRRTLMLALLLGPLLYPVLMLGIGKMAESRTRTELDKVLEVPVLGAERAPRCGVHDGVELRIAGSL